MLAAAPRPARRAHGDQPAAGASFTRMPDLTPSQTALRNRIEGAIALASPLLDVLLGVGERISRIAEPTDHDYYPVASGPAAAEADPARREPNPTPEDGSSG